MHKGMVFLFNIVATGCHFKDPIALRHNFSIALPIKLSSLYFTQQIKDYDKCILTSYNCLLFTNKRIRKLYEQVVN